MSNLLKRIATDFGVTIREARMLVNSAPKRYKVFEIDKRNGTKRLVAQPAKEIKALQKWLVENVLSELPIHDCATAYRSGRGIKYNASKHVNNAYLLKMDFRKYFPSIKKLDLAKHLASCMTDRFDADDIDFICNIALWRPKNINGRLKAGRGLELCIGGPSSPFIANSIAYAFDLLVSEECKRMGVTYTRYADDLTFSTNEKGVLREIESFVTKACKQVEYPYLRINTEKTVHASKKHKRFVTGVTLSSQGKLSLGRVRKRNIRAAIHKFTQGQLDSKSTLRLRGLLAFALDVEPSFIKSMKNKYGDHKIESILKWEKPV
ncbi:retron St85 family RNA-directed DNA polymerase [Magnetovibrio sp. PR-2]|uniref:retron St85 family RNA-directed DNA polymerase n=1 Tax=Magnetovibrio sp. PR-2 TaxID=3120356 RepID=UPI002FCE1136